MQPQGGVCKDENSEFGSTVDILIMHMVIMHKSHNASIFQDPNVVRK
jgi:hypothetical protein